MPASYRGDVQRTTMCVQSLAMRLDNDGHSLEIENVSVRLAEWGVQLFPEGSM